MNEFEKFLKDLPEKLRNEIFLRKFIILLAHDPDLDRRFSLLIDDECERKNSLTVDELAKKLGKDPKYVREVLDLQQEK